MLGTKRILVDGPEARVRAAVLETVGKYCQELPPFRLNCQIPFAVSAAVTAMPRRAPSVSLTELPPSPDRTADTSCPGLLTGFSKIVGKVELVPASVGD